jgi:hypothetical protein
MIRPAAIEIALFLAPFVLYFLYLWATRADVIHPAAWPMRTLVALTTAAVVVAIVGFGLLAQFSGAPPGETYQPAHMEGGKLVPGSIR